MRIRMTHPRYTSEANVLPNDVPTWAAKGWKRVDELHPPTEDKKEAD